MNKYFYIAYGSNMNHHQMAHRCPNAEFYDYGILQGYSLEFRRVADVIPSDQPTDYVPVGIWVITDECLVSLDAYEGYPNLYDREVVKVLDSNDDIIEGMVYYMKKGSFAPPSSGYYNGIIEGYRDCLCMSHIHKLTEARTRALCEALGVMV